MRHTNTVCLFYYFFFLYRTLITSCLTRVKCSSFSDISVGYKSFFLCRYTIYIPQMYANANPTKADIMILIGVKYSMLPAANISSHVKYTTTQIITTENIVDKICFAFTSFLFLILYSAPFCKNLV